MFILSHSRHHKLTFISTFSFDEFIKSYRIYTHSYLFDELILIDHILIWFVVHIHSSIC